MALPEHRVALSHLGAQMVVTNHVLVRPAGLLGDHLWQELNKLGGLLGQIVVALTAATVSTIVGYNLIFMSHIINLTLTSEGLLLPDLAHVRIVWQESALGCGLFDLPRSTFIGLDSQIWQVWSVVAKILTDSSVLDLEALILRSKALTSNPLHLAHLQLFI